MRISLRPFKIIYLSLLATIFGINAIAQTTITNETFNRTTGVSGAGSPTTYNEFNRGTFIGFAAYGTIAIASNALTVTSNALAEGSCAVISAMPTVAPYEAMLANNTAPLTWTFNMHTSQAITGITGNNYGQAVVLAGTALDVYSSGNGYAVAMASNGSVQLINYTTGLSGTISTIIGAGPAIGSGLNNISVKAVYDPNGNNWSLYVRNDSTTVSADPLTGAAYTQVGVTTTNNTYTSTLMTAYGFIYNYKAAANKVGFFDNYTLSIKPAITLSPATLAFGAVTPGSTAILTTNVQGYGFAAGPGNITVSAPAGYTVQSATGTPSTYASSVTIPYTGTSMPSTAINVKFSPSALTSYTGAVTLSGGGLPSASFSADQIGVTGTGAAACTGTPTAGVTVSTGGGTCGAAYSTLSLAGSTTGSGSMGYQWQTSTDNSTYTPISGGTNSTYVTASSTSAYYRCVVTCTASGLNNTSFPTYVEVPNCVTMANGSSSTCNALFYSSNGSTGTYAINESSTYTFYPSTLGNKINVAFNAFFLENNYDFLSIYNGNSASATLIGTYTGTTLPATVTSTASDGSLTFVFTSDYSVNYSGWAATVTCITAPVCSGAPTAGTTVASVSAGCPGYSSTMTLSGIASTAASGIGYQWYKNTGAGYNAISGATSNTYAATVNAGTENYKCTLTCSITGANATSTAATVASTQPITAAGNATTICQGTTLAMSNNISGGTWSSSSAARVAINSSTGVATGGTTAGTATITYTGGGCTQTYALLNVLNPAAITPATAAICAGASITLSNTATNGTWSSSNTALATVSATGVVTGVAPGTPVITYNNGCGTATTRIVTVNIQPVAITGVPYLCTNLTTSLANATPSGTWSSTNTGIATISPAGVVYARTTAGTTTISYTLGSCTATLPMNINAVAPAAIGGTASACLGSASILTETSTGGQWSTSNAAIASVLPTSGSVTAVANGSATITYNNGCGIATKPWTSNGTAVTLGYSGGGLMGPICSGSTLALTSGTTTGGTYAWTGPNGYNSTSQNPSIASATPLASGIYTFSATVNACATGNKYLFVAVDATPTVTATASPSAICSGGSASLTQTVLPATGTGNYAVNAISYQLFDTTGTALTAGDDGATAVSLPFTFNFFGNNYASINIGNNGYVNFGSLLAGNDYTSVALPTAANSASAPYVPGAMIALFWANLKPATAGNIRYTTLGSAPNRKFVVSYNQVADLNTPANRNNGQIVLYETSNIIELYTTKANMAATNTPTCGIQNSTGTIGYTVQGRNHANYTLSDQAGTGWRFAVPSYSYTWSPATALSATTGSVAISSGLTGSTTYTNTVIDANNGCSTATSASTTLTVNPLPTVAITPATGCAGMPLAASGANSYSWGPVTGLSAYTVANVTPSASVAATTYTVTGTTAAGCVGTGTITVNAAPVVTVTPTAGTMCAGGTQSLTASGAHTYSWSPAAALSTTTGANVSASPTLTTTYSVMGTNTITGCSSLIAATSSITVGATPVAGSLTAATGYCIGSGSPFVINAAAASGSGSILSYNWAGPNGYTATTATPSVSLTPSTTLASGIYSLTVTYPGIACVSAPVTTSSVTVANYPTAYNVTGGNGCSAAGITVGLDNSQSGISYQLQRLPATNIATVSGTTTTLSFSPMTTVGVYKVVATGPAGCQTAMTGNDTIRLTPSISLGTAPSVCQPTTASAIGFSSPAGSPTSFSVDWHTAANTAGYVDVSGTPISGSSITLTLPTTLSTAGAYDADITVSNGSCASAVYPAHIMVYANPTAAISGITVPCSGHSGTVNFTGADSAIANYTVDGGATNTFTFTGPTHSISTGNITTPHTYVLTNAHNPVCSNVYHDTVTVIPVAMAWVGGAPGHLNDWSAASNWTCGFAPTVTDDITIGATTYSPVMPASGVARNVILDAGSALSIMTGNNLSVKGNLMNNSAINGTGKLVMNGAAAQHITGKGSISNLELDNTAGAAIDTGSHMVISSTLYVTSGILKTNDSLEMGSSDILGTARIAQIPASGASIQGRVKVDQYVQGGFRRFRFWSHPFSDTLSLSQIQQYVDITGTGGGANGFTYTLTNAASAFRYDPYTGNSNASYDPGWKSITRINAAAADTNKLHPGQGLRLFFRGGKGEGLGYTGYTGDYVPSPVTVQMTGHVNQGPQTIILAKGSTDSANQEYNMLGNPYPSPVDMGTILYNAKQAGQIVGSAFYVWTASSPGGGQFITVPIGISAPSPYYLGAHTAFEVRAHHNGAVLNFSETDKTANVSTYLFKEPAQYVSLGVYDANNSLWDMLRVQFNNAATDNDDQEFDATRPMGTDCSFYTISPEGHKLAIDARPYTAGTLIPLGFNSSYRQDYTIRATNMAIPAGGSLYLHDKLLDKTVEMTEGTEYKFTVTKDKATQGELRFELGLKPAATPSIRDMLTVGITPNPATSDVVITFASGNKDDVNLRVLDMSGVSIYSQKVSGQQNGTISVPLGNLAAGIYIVEVTKGDEKTIQKLVKE